MQSSDAPAGMPMPAPEVRQNPSGPRNLSALAAIAMEGGATRYDIPYPITVPERARPWSCCFRSASPGKQSFSLRPTEACPTRRPIRSGWRALPTRAAGSWSEVPSPSSSRGRFWGRGWSTPSPDGATTTVPFALERGLAVETVRTYTEEGARIARIEAGALTIERDTVNRTRYRVKNGSDKLAKVLLKHPRQPQARLHNPPKGTEDNVGSGSALVPADAGPHAVTDLTVDERQSFERNVDWLSQEADDAIKALPGRQARGCADREGSARVLGRSSDTPQVDRRKEKALRRADRARAFRPKRPAETCARSRRTRPRPTCGRSSPTGLRRARSGSTS